jgi:hypothetical protein
MLVVAEHALHKLALVPAHVVAAATVREFGERVLLAAFLACLERGLLVDDRLGLYRISLIGPS